MSTNHTSNYQLSQWVKSDQVKMEDFNADNAKIDAALAGKADKSALSSLTSTVNGKASTSALNSLKSTVDGLKTSKADKSALDSLSSTVSGQGTALSQRNCRFVTGSYTGTGEYGSANANSLTFPQKPVFVCVTSDGTGVQLNLTAGQKSTLVSSSGGVSGLVVTWGSKSVSWYVENPSATSVAPSHQMNAASMYHYFAVLEIA